MVKFERIDGNNFKRARESNNLSIDTLAEMSNINFDLLINIELGNTKTILKSRFDKLVFILGCTPEYLRGDIDWDSKLDKNSIPLDQRLVNVLNKVINLSDKKVKLMICEFLESMVGY